MDGTAAQSGLPCHGLGKLHSAPLHLVWRTTISSDDADELRQLLAECTLGNRQAFENLYRRVSKRLFAVALRCMNRSDLAEEVLQESFVRIWHNASRYDGNLSAPMTWMISITRNQAIDQLRKHREVPLTEEQADILFDDSPSAHEQLDSQREAQALQHCLDMLEGMQRTSIVTAYFQGVSYADLAMQSAAPLGSVKSWIRRGMERLRRCLES
ncbi:MULTISPECIES: sigma-70 family RNA polymerase sigma factor [unclassified Pseudomonas]|uniref:sigma-70 family RNA polymerase sigma factor n=1 Tax=unclassified Pseudomonas TaxID=196821 RepID=UPI003A0FEDFA